jgi:hypothetical protein
VKTSARQSWEITPTKVNLAVRKIIEVGNPLIHDMDELLEIAQNRGIVLPDDVRAFGLLTP